ncbi:lysine--tRNA ligase [bacterium]|nr:lysine--tRNA ligase [bacterium]
MSDERGQFFEQKLANLKALEEIGVNAYGKRFETTSTLEELRDGFKEGQIVKAAGRMMAYRGHGKSIFIDMKDKSSKMQLYFQKNIIGEDNFNIFKKIEIGDIIGVEGETFFTRMGEPTLKVESFTLLSKSLLPLPEKWHGLKDVEIRYRQRYLDLIVNDEVRQVFKTRSMIIKNIRNFFDSKGFLEVETPMMQSLAGGATARPFETFHNALGIPLYLRIAPELYLKRLLVGGLERVYEINRNFRNEGISRRHNPEFTMLEVYQAYADYEVMMELTETLVSELAKMVWGDTKREMKDGNVLDFTVPWKRITLTDAVKDVCSVDFLTVEDPHKAARECDIEVSPEMTRDEILTQAFESFVEGNLYQPTFITEYPASLCPLAKTIDDKPNLTARFELIVRGQELANAYSELNNPVEQRKRLMDQLDKSDDKNKRIDEDFVKALEYGMPPAGGLGIGIDRLVMALTDSDSIRDVILFPQLKPEAVDTKSENE